MSGFTPPAGSPSILELATMLWGAATNRHDPKDIRFGKQESKSVNTIDLTWHDFEKNEGGGYLDIHKMAMGGPPPRRANGKDHDGPKPWDSIERAYDYRDATGKLIVQNIRMTLAFAKANKGRRFMQRRPDSGDWSGWSWKVRGVLPDENKPLYRLPELIASGNAIVWFTEGEKDADNLAKLGLTSTTNIGGANKWLPHYREALVDKHVVVLQDNDPGGELHVHVVARALMNVAASVKVLLLPGLKPKGDVSDWLSDGGTVDELERLGREAPEYAPPPPPPPPVDPGEEPPEPDPDDPGAEIEEGALITEQFAMRTFLAAFSGDLRFNHSSNTWLVWADHRWRPDERKLAFSWSLNLCRELAATIQGKDPSKGRLVVEKVRFSGAVETGARAMPPVATAQEDWDANRWLLGTPGGVVDLKTGELRAGRREDMISRQTSVTPADMPDCPTWLAFLDYAMHGDDQRVQFIQRYFGYCLTGLTNEEVFLFMFGIAGAGKGTMVETVAHIMGDYAGTIPMEVFAGVPKHGAEYYRADMVGRRLIVANEPERGAFWAEAFIKDTTGGDTLSGRHPMGRPFRFKPTHKLALQGNHMPRLRGRSTGMERRLRILPFDRKADPPDLELKAKLITEAPAILRWLIEGCLAWQKRKLDPPDSVRIAGVKYFEGQDAFARWVEDRCILDRYAEHTPSELAKSFNEWARANGEDEMNGNAFREALDQYECDPPLKSGKQKSRRWVRGLRIMPTETTNRWGDP